MAELIKSGTRYKEENINFTKDSPINITQIKNLIANEINKYSIFSPPKNRERFSTCVRRNAPAFPNQATVDLCDKEENPYRQKDFANNMAEAISLLAKKNVTIPSSSKITRDWKGGKYAYILIPSSQFAKHKNMVINIYHHIAGDPSKRVGEFKDSPFQISIPLMRQNKALDTIDPKYKSFNYAIVDLRVDVNI